MIPSLTSHLILLVLPALLLTGCAPEKPWMKPGATYEQFTKDSYECAQQHSRGRDLRKDIMYRPVSRRRAINGSQAARGRA